MLKSIWSHLGQYSSNILGIHLDLVTAGLATADFCYRRSNFWKKFSKFRDIFLKISAKKLNCKEANKDLRFLDEQMKLHLCIEEILKLIGAGNLTIFQFHAKFTTY